MASDTLPPNAAQSKGGRSKVHLKPGFHLVDWMNLMRVSSSSGSAQRKIGLAELATHTSQFDCWTAYNGKVYNITQYMHYHPGGVPMLMKGAGKDSTKLFNRYHAWVNLESMLGKCLMGVLAADEHGIAEGSEEEAEGEEEREKEKEETKEKETKEGKEKAGAEERSMEEMRLRAQAALSSSSNDEGGEGGDKEEEK